MTFLDFVAFGGSMASILGIFLYFYQKSNNKMMKGLITDLGNKMDEGFRRMDEGFRRMDEGFRRMDEGFRMISEKMDEGFRMISEKMDEGFKLIARLISEENERSRKEILEKLKEK